MTDLQREHHTADIATGDLIAWLREQARVLDLSTGFVGAYYDDEEEASAHIAESLHEAALLLEIADRLEQCSELEEARAA